MMNSSWIKMIFFIFVYSVICINDYYLINYINVEQVNQKYD